MLNVIKVAVNHSILKFIPGQVTCHENGEGWCFETCLLTTPIYMTHVLTTMQTAAMVRSVFIKTTKKVTAENLKDDVVKFRKELYNAVWEKENAADHHNCPEEVADIIYEAQKRVAENAKKLEA